MFQSFDARSNPESGAARLKAARKVLDDRGLDGFLVPRADAHQGEFVAERDERLAWLTGFTGSAGLAIVTREKAAVFVDGRYHLQVRDQIDLDQFAALRIPEDKPGEWLCDVASDASIIGYDPWLHTRKQIDDIEDIVKKCGITLRPTDNIIDQIWTDQPDPPSEPIETYPEAMAGRTASEKRDVIAEALRDDDIAACVLSAPDSIAWLLNIRGSDIRHTPVMLAFAIVHRDATVEIFIDPSRCEAGLREHLGAGVTWRESEAFGASLDALKGRIQIDRTTAPVWICDRLEGNGSVEIVWARDPCVLPKACKTDAEIAGSKAAHLRDGAAMVSLLCDIDTAVAENKQLTEIDVVRTLEARRVDTGALRDISFDTISGSGPNGAIVHYRVNEATNRTIMAGDLLLIDSGGQYLDGTTDITRTIAIGDPSAEAIRAFTLVLKGLIAMSALRWPPGLAGRDLDAIARSALWQAGFDYDHGTGHGVGSYLGVHEGPQGLSRRSLEPLKPGMFLSVEPGYYREGAFGIRTENLVVVKPPEIPSGGDREMLGFETLTLAPIDHRLIDLNLLDRHEIDWLDAYHARVREALESSVPPETATWLRAATAPVASKTRQGDGWDQGAY